MIKDNLPERSFSSLLAAPLILIMLSTISVACGSNVPQENETIGGCTILPKGFSDKELVGTWAAGSPSYPRSSDTFIIRSDGTYKQVIQVEYPPAEYESDWQAPWFEYRDNGTGYLHLDDYRGCAAHINRSCDWANDDEIPWADVCEQQWMDPGPRAGKILLVVRGIPGNSAENRSHPFILTLNRGFESSPWSYSYSGP